MRDGDDNEQEHPAFFGPGDSPGYRADTHRSDGDIGLVSTAEKIVVTAVKRFGSVDALVNNAGIFFAKPFTEYTPEDFRTLSSTNLDGFIHTTQLVVKQMLAQAIGGSVVSITASIADHPLAVFTASVPMITKGGINAISRSLAMEYAKQGIRVNVVAPGVVDTPLLKDAPKDFLRTLSPVLRKYSCRRHSAVERLRA